MKSKKTRFSLQETLCFAKKKKKNEEEDKRELTG